MSDNFPGYFCFHDLVDNNCPNCITGGGYYVKLYDGSINCCAWEMGNMQGGIIEVVKNLTDCPGASTPSDGDHDDILMGYPSFVPVVIGAMLVGGFAAFAFRKLRGYFKSCFGPSRFFYSPARRENIEMATFMDMTRGDLSAVRSATLNNYAAGMEAQALLSTPPPRSYCTGTTEYVVAYTASNPVYDEFHGLTQSIEDSSPAVSPGFCKNSLQILEVEMEGCQTQDDGLSEPARVHAAGKGREEPSGYDADAEDDDEDGDLTLPGLKPWGKSGRVKCYRKRLAVSSSSEMFEAITEM